MRIKMINWYARWTVCVIETDVLDIDSILYASRQCKRSTK